MIFFLAFVKEIINNRFLMNFISFLFYEFKYKWWTYFYFGEKYFLIFFNFVFFKINIFLFICVRISREHFHSSAMYPHIKCDIILYWRYFFCNAFYWCHSLIKNEKIWVICVSFERFFIRFLFLCIWQFCHMNYF